MPTEVVDVCINEKQRSKYLTNAVFSPHFVSIYVKQISLAVKDGALFAKEIPGWNLLYY